MTFESARCRKDSDPLKRGLAAFLNDFAQALRRGDLAEQEEITAIMEAGIPEYDRSPEVLEHDNPEMLRAAMRSGWAYQRRLFAEAMHWDGIALLAATYPNVQVNKSEKSARIARLTANLCSECVQLAISNHEGRRKDWETESVKWGQIATAEEPSNPEYRLEYGCALDQSRRHEEAEREIGPVIPLVDFSDRSNALAARILYFDDLLRREHLPSVKKLLKMISDHHGERNSHD